MPLVVSGAPAGPAGVEDDRVETTQIAPTILRLLGLDPDAPRSVRIEHTRVLPLLNPRLRLRSRALERVVVERLRDEELALVRPLLVDLHLHEQPHYADHPQLTREQLEESMDEVRPTFAGENVIFAVRDGAGGLAGFCWVVLFDPGTGLEGEVAEVYVAEDHRGRGVGEALLRRAVDLFRSRGVTLGYVWTRSENEAATRLYRSAGFEPTRQLVLTWYPSS